MRGRVGALGAVNVNQKYGATRNLDFIVEGIGQRSPIFD